MPLKIKHKFLRQAYKFLYELPPTYTWWTVFQDDPLVPFSWYLPPVSSLALECELDLGTLL